MRSSGVVYVAGLCHDGEAVDCDAAGHASWASHWRRTVHFDEYDVIPVVRDRGVSRSDAVLRSQLTCVGHVSDLAGVELSFFSLRTDDDFGAALTISLVLPRDDIAGPLPAGLLRQPLDRQHRGVSVAFRRDLSWPSACDPQARQIRNVPNASSAVHDRQDFSRTFRRRYCFFGSIIIGRCVTSGIANRSRAPEDLWIQTLISWS